MAKKDIFVVALKIAGIYLLVRAVESIQTIFMIVGTWDNIPVLKGIETYGMIVGSIMPFLLFVITGVYLLKRADQIAIKLSKDDASEVMPGALTKDGLQEIGFSVVGILLVANAIPQVATHSVYLFLSYSYPKGTDSRIWASVISYLAVLALGIFLIFGAKAVRGFIRKCQRD
ncbi:MAG: hypothetical protein ABH952_09300 [Candidatus Omnitrophota bacterium]